MSSPFTAVVTGAAGGIGRGLATVLAANATRVHLVDIDGPALERVAAEIDQSVAVRADVTDPVEMDALAAHVGRVDVLCLNAGVVSTVAGPPWEASPEEWDRVLGVNLLGVVNGLRAFVPRLLDHGSPSRILITASLAGAATWPGGGPYAASKHAVLALAEQTALALADSNVSVSVLCPALVRSGMSDDGAEPLVVATDALRAMDEGQFAIIPAEWSAAVRSRVVDLVAGKQPTLPAP